MENNLDNQNQNLDNQNQNQDNQTKTFTKEEVDLMLQKEADRESVLQEQNGKKNLRK